MKDIYRYGILLFLVFVVGTAFFRYQMGVQIDGIRKEALENTRKQFFASQSAFDKLSQNFYNDYNDYLARMLYMVRGEKDGERESLREELLTRLYPAYHSATLFGLNQFQVYDGSGRSFLRFHYSDYRDDDLKAVRPAVRKLIREKRFLKGFEVGRFVDGLRYLYPLFYDGEFVGGYEWVWNHETLIRELRRIYGGRYGIIVRSSGMRHIVLPREIRRHYARFVPCSDFLYHKSAFGIYGPDFVGFMNRLFDGKGLCRALEKDESFSFLRELDGREYLVKVVALKTITGKPYGYFISVSEEERIAQIYRLFLIEVVLLLLGLLLIFLLLYRSYRDRMFVRTLIDSQKDIVILTNGIRLTDANRTFLEFFDVKSPEEFVDRYGCICNLFIEEKGFVGRVNDGKDWLEYMRDNDRENRVIMFDRRRGEERIFMVSLNRFDNTGLYVISFRDITELEREKRHFKIESMMDHLTALYNKRSFEHFLKDRLEDLRRFKRGEVALVMFDIDHFKQINDRFGHRTGDEVLRHLAALVQSKMRQSDFLARWGGEEFMMIMEGSGLEGACRKAEMLRELIEAEDFGIPGGLTCSFGVTVLRPDDTIETAQERVDQLLYRAKNGGRNRVVCEA